MRDFATYTPRRRHEAREAFGGGVIIIAFVIVTLTTLYLIFG